MRFSVPTTSSCAFKKFSFERNCGYASCKTSSRPTVPAELFEASITACFCSGVLSPPSPCGACCVAFRSFERASAILPKTSCSCTPASFAVSIRLLSRSERRCRLVSTFAHLPFTFSCLVVRVLLPQPLAVAVTKTIKANNISRRLVISFLLVSRFVKFVYHLNNAFELRHVSAENVVSFLIRRGQIITG